MVTEDEQSAFFIRVDSISSLIVNRYSRGIPADVVDELDSVSAEARRCGQAGIRLVSEELLDALLADSKLVAQLTKDVKRLQSELQALERMDGER
jgi:hypothetical protein